MHLSNPSLHFILLEAFVFNPEFYFGASSIPTGCEMKPGVFRTARKALYTLVSVFSRPGNIQLLSPLPIHYSNLRNDDFKTFLDNRLTSWALTPASSPLSDPPVSLHPSHPTQPVQMSLCSQAWSGSHAASSPGLLPAFYSNIHERLSFSHSLLSIIKNIFKNPYENQMTYMILKRKESLFFFASENAVNIGVLLLLRLFASFNNTA